MKPRKRALVGVGIILVLLTSTAFAEPTPKGYMGIWWQDFNSMQFYLGFREAMESEEVEEQYGYYEDALYYCCSENKPWGCALTPSQFDPPHPGLLLENYREWAECSGNPQAGLDENDEEAVILVVNSHGDVKRQLINGTHYYTYCFSNYCCDPDDPNDCGGTGEYDPPTQRKIDVNSGCEIDCNDGDLEWRSCLKNLRRKSGCYDRELIRFGTSTERGTRWVVLVTCHGLDLGWDDNEDGDFDDPGDVPPPCLPWRVWCHPDLNGGYRMVAGVSGKFDTGEKSQGREFVKAQLKEYMPLRLAWFYSMMGEGGGSVTGGRGDCVVMAKGSSPDEAEARLYSENFQHIGSVPAAQPNENDEWFTALSFKNCSAVPPIGDPFVETPLDDDKYTRVVRVPNVEQVHRRFVLFNYDVSPEDVLQWAQIVAAIVGVPESERNIYQIEDEDELTHTITVRLGTDGRWVFTYYQRSTYWSFTDTLEISNLSDKDTKPRLSASEAKGAFEGEPEPSQQAIAKVEELWDKLAESELMKEGLERARLEIRGFSNSKQFIEGVYAPVFNVIYEVPDDGGAGGCPPFDAYIDYEQFHFYFLIEHIILYHPYFIIELEPPTYNFTRITKWFRFNVPTDIVVDLPTQSELEAKANEIKGQYCYDGLKCKVDIGVGYVEKGPYERQFDLDPMVIATYEAKTPTGDTVRETLYYNVSDVAGKAKGKMKKKRFILPKGGRDERAGFGAMSNLVPVSF